MDIVNDAENKQMDPTEVYYGCLFTSGHRIRLSHLESIRGGNWHVLTPLFIMDIKNSLFYISLSIL